MTAFEAIYWGITIGSVIVVLYLTGNFKKL